MKLYHPLSTVDLSWIKPGRLPLERLPADREQAKLDHIDVRI